MALMAFKEIVVHHLRQISTQSNRLSTPSSLFPSFCHRPLFLTDNKKRKKRKRGEEGEKERKGEKKKEKERKEKDKYFTCIQRFNLYP
jgi:hypothetical protein